MLRRILQRSSRSESGPSTTADHQQAAPTPTVVQSTPTTAPPAPGALPRHHIGPQQLALLPRMPVAPGAVTPIPQERLLQTTGEDAWDRYWTPQPSPRNSGGAAADEDAVSRAYGCFLAPSDSIPPRDARRPTIHRAATTQDALASSRGLAVLRDSHSRTARQGSYGRVLLPSQAGNGHPSLNNGNTQHQFSPEFLALAPAELSPNIPQELAGSPLVTTVRETGERFVVSQRELVPVWRDARGVINHYVHPDTLASYPSELTATVPESLASAPVGLSRQPGEGPFTPLQTIPLRTHNDPFLAIHANSNYQGEVQGQQLPEDTAYSSIVNTTGAHRQAPQSPVRMPFGSSSSAEATRSGNSEGWVTTSNLSRQDSEVVTRPAINQAGRSLTHDNSNFASQEAGRAVGSGSLVEPGRTDHTLYGRHLPASAPWSREPFPRFQAQVDQGSAGIFNPEAQASESTAWYYERDFVPSAIQRFAEPPQRPARMLRDRELTQDAELLAPPPPLPQRRSRNNPFFPSGTYGEQSSFPSPYASQVYQHPPPMPMDHRNPFAATPPRLPLPPVQPPTGYPRAHVVRSPEQSEGREWSSNTAGQSDRPWTRPSNAAVERSPDLDGSTMLSTPARPRTRYFGDAVERNPGEVELASPIMTPSGTAHSLPSTTGPWVSNYGLRSSFEIPAAHLDAVTEASSSNGDFVGEGQRMYVSSTRNLVPGRGQNRSPARSSSQTRPNQDKKESESADSSWIYDWPGDNRAPTPYPRSTQAESMQGGGPTTTTTTTSAEASAPPQAPRRPMNFSRNPRVNLPPRVRTPPLRRIQTVRERPSPRDFRGLRTYLNLDNDNQPRPRSAEHQANTVTSIMSGSSPRVPRPADRHVTFQPVTWTDIPLGNPPNGRPAPPHSQRLSQLALRRQWRLSLIFLILCHLVPPLLFLYHRGRLDWFMNWWTDGHIPKMDRYWKGKALYSGFIILFTAFFAIPVYFIVIRTANHS